jgi:hypothetical protein
VVGYAVAVYFSKKGTSMSKQIALTFTLLFSLASLRAMDAPEKNINLDILTEGKAIELIDLTHAELQSKYPGIHKIIQQNFPNSAHLLSRDEVNISVYQQHSSFGPLLLWQTYYREDKPMATVTIEDITIEDPGIVSYHTPALTSWFLLGLVLVYGGTKIYESLAKKGTINSFRV